MYACSLLWLFLTLSSCEKETMKYEGSEGIYFAVQWGPTFSDSTEWGFQNYTPVEFIKVGGTDYTVKLRVRVTGNVKSYDRSFGIKVNKDSTSAVEGEDFEAFLPEYQIKAGQLFTDIPIKMLRSEALLTEKRILGIDLVPSSDLSIGIPTWYPLDPYFASDREQTFNATFHQIESSDFITKPTVWYGANINGVEAGLFWEFSVKKFLLICELLDLEYEDFQSTATMHSIRRQIVNQTLKAYLQDMFDKKTPILEDDGRLMWAMGVSWSSTIGVPYKP